MSHGPTPIVLERLQDWLVQQAAEPLPDQLLLTRFIECRDERAFAALLHRHGPLVYGLCRRWLGDRHQAEDAFQATFLVLARKAASIGKRDSLGAWLHGVAYRVAQRMRWNADRRLEQRSLAAPASPARPPEDVSWREICSLLDEELQRLPVRYRAPLVLCHLQGQTREEAAQNLGLPLGTLKHRLEQGRTLLRNRLVRRGVELSALLLALDTSTAQVPAVVLSETLRSAISAQPESGVFATALTTLLSGMGFARQKLFTAVLAVGLLVAGFSALQRVGTQEPGLSPEELAAAPAANTRDLDNMELPPDPLPPGATARLGSLRFGKRASAFTSDGQALISWGQNQPIQVWDLATGKELGRYGDEKSPPYPFIRSADGKLMAGRKMRDAEAARALAGKPNYSSWDGPVRVWEAATGKELGQFGGAEERGSGSNGFSPDGKLLATGGNDRTIRIWDVATQKVVRQFEGHTEAIDNGVCFLCNGRTLISASLREKFYRVWDVTEGKELARLDAGGASAQIWWLTAGDQALLSVDWKGTAYLVDVRTGKELSRFPVNLQSACALSPDRRVLAFAAGAAVELRDLVTGERLHQFEHPAEVYRISFSPDSKWLVSSCKLREKVRLWDVATGKQVGDFGEAGNGNGDLLFSPDGKVLVVGGSRFWSMATQKEFFAGRHLAGINALAFSPDGRFVASGDDAEAIHLWERTSGKPLRKWTVPVGSVRSLAFSPDGRTLAAGSKNGTTHVWEVDGGKEVLALQGKGDRVGYSPDGKLLAIVLHGPFPGQPGKVSLLEAGTGKVVREFPGGDYGAAFSPDGRLLAAASSDRKTIHVWHVATGKEFRRFPGWSGVAFSLDGRSLATIDYDQKNKNLEVCLWDVAGQRERRRFPGGESRGQPPVFSPDGRTLAVAGYRSNNPVVYDLATGEQRGKFEGHQGMVGPVAFAPDGRSLASGSRDTTVLLWDTTALSDMARQARRPLSPAEVQARWIDLASADGPQAYRALWELVADPERSVPFLARSLRPVAGTDPRRLQQMIADLDSDQFNTRELAFTELEKLGELAAPPLLRVLASQPSVETFQRAERLMEKMEGPTMLPPPERRQVLHAIEALERIGTPAAQQVLQELAKGGEGAAPTREASAALLRLNRGMRSK
jgi:RNA polymerase sigma factor (sigma-70 family)